MLVFDTMLVLVDVVCVGYCVLVIVLLMEVDVVIEYFLCYCVVGSFRFCW